MKSCTHIHRYHNVPGGCGEHWVGCVQSEVTVGLKKEPWSVGHGRTGTVGSSSQGLSCAWKCFPRLVRAPCLRVS